MNKRHRLRFTAAILVPALLAGCAHYSPYIGQPFSEWKNQADFGTMKIPQMVLAEGNVQAWTLGDGIFYYFQNGSLYKVNQGVESQERVQIEVLNK